jgi:hypothetical protein
MRQLLKLAGLKIISDALRKSGRRRDAQVSMNDVDLAASILEDTVREKMNKLTDEFTEKYEHELPEKEVPLFAFDGEYWGFA